MWRETRKELNRRWLHAYLHAWLPGVYLAALRVGNRRCIYKLASNKVDRNAASCKGILYAADKYHTVFCMGTETAFTHDRDRYHTSKQTDIARYCARAQKQSCPTTAVTSLRNEDRHDDFLMLSDSSQRMCFRRTRESPSEVTGQFSAVEYDSTILCSPSVTSLLCRH